MIKLFYSGLAGLALFEIGMVYFIMPMPGSQRIESLDVAYFLHTQRWMFRTVFLLMIAAGGIGVVRGAGKKIPLAAGFVTLLVVWFMNFQMSAESIFKLPAQLSFKARLDSTVDESSVIVGIEFNGEAKAYPIRYLVYHHQVQDSVGGKPVLVTYCSVCRTGRVFDPVIDGRRETFRLVGMDHFNAMFEDATTGSWWRQATGEAVTGPRKGATLADTGYSQVTLHKWFERHPAALVMQPDEPARSHYDAEGRFERGKSKGDLTRTDTLSWKDKSWVVGLQIGSETKAYDWNRLKAQRVINDRIGETAIVLALAVDQKSFAVFERPDGAMQFTIDRDVISAGGRSYNLSGANLAEPAQRLKRLKAYQEFWHSWRTFHPDTRRYE